MDLIDGWMDRGMDTANRIHKSVIHHINLAYENEKRIISASFRPRRNQPNRRADYNSDFIRNPRVL